MATKKKTTAKKPAEKPIGVRVPAGGIIPVLQGRQETEAEQIRELYSRYAKETGAGASQTTVQNLILWYEERAKLNELV